MIGTSTVGPFGRATAPRVPLVHEEPRSKLNNGQGRNHGAGRVDGKEDHRPYAVFAMSERLMPATHADVPARKGDVPITIAVDLPAADFIVITTVRSGPLSRRCRVA